MKFVFAFALLTTAQAIRLYEEPAAEKKADPMANFGSSQDVSLTAGQAAAAATVAR